MALTARQLKWAQENGVTPTEGPPRSLFKSPDVEDSFNEYSSPKKEFLSKYPKALYSSLGRGPEENSIVGGVPTSKHLTKDAADVSYRGGNIDDIERDITKLGGKALRESDHLHIEFPEGFDNAAPQPLTERQKLWAKQNGLKYPGMELETNPVDALGEVKEHGLGLGNSVRRAANTTAAGVLSPMAGLLKYAGPSGGMKAAEYLTEKMGLTPPENPLMARADQEVDKLQEIINQGATEQPSEWEQKTGVDFTKPLVDLNAENTKLGLQKLANSLGIDKNSGLYQGTEEGLARGGEIIGDFTSPTNLALLAAGLKSPTVAASRGTLNQQLKTLSKTENIASANKAAMGSFVPGMAQGAVEGGKTLIEGIEEGDPRKIGSGLVEAGASGAFTAGAMKGMVERPKAIERKTVRPEETFDKFLESTKPKEQTAPENPRTLNIQAESLASGRSKALLVTPGEVIPQAPKYTKQLETDVGTWVYDPLKVSEKIIREKVQDGTYGELLGHVEPKSEKTTQTVLAEQDGVEARGSLVSPENVQVQASILKSQFPNAEIKVGGPELAAEVLKNRKGGVDLMSQRGSFSAMPIEKPSAQVFEGNGEMKTRGLSKSIEKAAVDKNLVKDLGELPQYKTTNWQDQFSKADEIIKNDPGLAKDIAMGKTEAPKGVLPEAVMIKLQKEATKNSDINLIRELSRSGLTAEASVHGARIGILSQIDPYDPVNAIRDVIQVREEVAKRRNGVKALDSVKKSITGKIKEEITKNLPTKQNWTDFIKSIEC